MSDHHVSPLSRRTFLKGSIAAGAMIGLGMGRNGALLPAAVAAGIQVRDWHTLPQNDGRTIEANAHELGGDLQLLRSADGSYQTSRTFISAPQSAPGRFNAVGMHWRADVPPQTTMTVEVRGKNGTTWSKWASVGHELPAREDRANVVEDETFTDVVEMGRASVMQYRITLTSSNPAVSPTVHRMTATQIDALDAPTLADLDARGKAIPFRVGTGGSPTARLILRDGPNGWGPGYIAEDDPRYWPPFTGQFPYQFVTVHHTAGANNPENPIAAVRAVWYYHAIYLGWGDIGYHFLIDQYGNVYQGRDGGNGTEAGHVYRYNHYNCGIALLGQFQPGATDVPYEGGDPTPEALQSTLRMVALEAAYHGWNPLDQAKYPKPGDWCRPQLTTYRLCSHRDWGQPGSCVATACPGDNVYKHLPAMRQQAADLIPRIKDFSLMELLK